MHTHTHTHTHTNRQHTWLWHIRHTINIYMLNNGLRQEVNDLVDEHGIVVVRVPVVESTRSRKGK